MLLNDKRVRIVVGHYGSGKTEFCMNYAMQLADLTKNISLIDLDIANVYFRSREQAKLLESKDIRVISSSLGHNLTLDLPALSAAAHGPLEDENCNVIIDVGGDAAGAKVLAQYRALIMQHEYDMFCVVNAKRDQTQDINGAINHIKAIEITTGLKITGLINNTHMLRETAVADLLKGQTLIEEVSKQLKIPVKYVAAIEEVAAQLSNDLSGEIFPMKLYMREGWMM